MNKKILAIVICSVLAVAFVTPLVVAGKGGKPGKPDKPDKPQIACKDGIDNDGDGYTDWPSDPGCVNKNDKSELGTTECDDGIDNDGDGLVDYNDAGCSSPTDNDETNCGDGVCEGGETQENCPEDCGYPDACSDTDGGYVVTVQGIVSGYSGGSPYSYTDYCLINSTTRLVEYECIGNQWESYQFDCIGSFTSCVNGACV